MHREDRDGEARRNGDGPRTPLHPASGEQGQRQRVEDDGAGGVEDDAGPMIAAGVEPPEVVFRREEPPGDRLIDPEPERRPGPPDRREPRCAEVGIVAEVDVVVPVDEAVPPRGPEGDDDQHRDRDGDRDRDRPRPPARSRPGPGWLRSCRVLLGSGHGRQRSGRCLLMIEIHTIDFDRYRASLSAQAPRAGLRARITSAGSAPIARSSGLRGYREDP